MDSQAAKETLHVVLSKLEEAQRLHQRPRSTPDSAAQIELLLDEAIESIRKALGIKMYPEPTVDPPDMETLEEWLLDSICEATDGCIVEADVAL